MRNSVINAAEIASYDQFKQIATQNLGMKDGILTHCSCAFSAGFVATIVGSPVDVLKTRLMNMSAGESGVAMVTGMVKNEFTYFLLFDLNFSSLVAVNQRR